jgi:hypothetical protein
MTIDRFDPPGHLDDFDGQQRVAWSDWISKMIDSARAGRPDEFDFDGPREQFFNPTRVDIAADQQPLDISWSAFPRLVKSSSVSDVQRWKTADGSRDVQDEYCEWSVQRDGRGKITRLTFTCEGPEYWEFLGTVAPDKVLTLYQKFVNAEVKREHLFDSEGYVPRNRWNTSTQSGAMHLIQDSNTLSAEIELAGGSSVVRTRNGKELTDEQELILCGRYGESGRNSDPHIGERVNSLTRQKADVTLANPVGLYFNDFTPAGWSAPDGSDPKQYWRYVRGSQNSYVRAVYEVPQGRNFVVGDITINGRPIEYGAQVADFITIKLTGIACRFGKSTAKPMTGCRTLRPGHGFAADTVEGALRARPRRR